jgi:hypothetical protein
MDAMYDLGGKQGFGKIRYAKDARAFHEPWEVRANALYALAVRFGILNMDEYRHAIERMEPRHYLTASYYERSLTGLATLCVEKGLVTREELERRAGGTFPLSGPSAAGRTNAATTSPTPMATPAASNPTRAPTPAPTRFTCPSWLIRFGYDPYDPRTSGRRARRGLDHLW